MAERDVLSELLHAWREDIESVPFPQFTALLIPRQPTRTQVDLHYDAEASAVCVTNATQGTDA